ncbi:MAG: hypothetical protein JEZ06_14450 [Anaerolineaceae bacterium]|nr:hypothetical protein [Anaerolineaceae bacterium]
MRTIRRIYFYLISIISLEMSIWGLIQLIQKAIKYSSESHPSIFINGLSLLLVGCPVFVFHFLRIQSDARQDVEEDTSFIRCLFLTGMRFTMAVFAILNLTQLISLIIIESLGDGFKGYANTEKTILDLLVIIIAHSLMWLFFHRILEIEKKTDDISGTLTKLKRFFRYAWFLFILEVTFFAWWRLLGALPLLFVDVFPVMVYPFAENLAYLLTAAPFWIISWVSIQKLLVQAEERNSTIRAISLMLIQTIGAFITLISLKISLGLIVTWIFKGKQVFSFIYENGAVISAILIGAVLWFYFGKHFQDHLKHVNIPNQKNEMQRLPIYVFSFLGLMALFAGTQQMVGIGIEFLLNQITPFGLFYELVGQGLSNLLIGLIVWLIFWEKIQKEIRESEIIKSRPRQSILRKGYLYLIIFLTVIGAMVSAGMMIRTGLDAFLKEVSGNTWVDIAQSGKFLVFSLLWLFYHLKNLRSDNQIIGLYYSEQHSNYAVLIFQVEESSFADPLVKVIRQETPRMLIAIHQVGSPLSENLEGYDAVVIPNTLWENLPEAVNLWLKEFHGPKIVVQLTQENWFYTSHSHRSLSDNIKQTAKIIRKLAEEEDHTTIFRVWNIAAWILLIIEAIYLVFSLPIIFP